MNKSLACIYFFIALCAISASAQTFSIQGKITDSATGKPVALASVFLSNTSIGTIADYNGVFTLNKMPLGRFDLVVSSLGYQTYVQTINARQLTQPLHISLIPKANELAAVVVGTYDPDGWGKWGKVFTDNFIGTSFLAQNCDIKNHEVIKFRYSKKKDVLQAFADEPIEIENRALGYMVRYKMEEFWFDFAARSLFYAGYPLFEEMSGSAGKQKRWQRRRKDAYFGSVMHFMRCLYTNKLAESGYEIKKLEKIPNKEKQRIQALYRYFINPDHSQEEFENSLPKDTLKYYKRILDQRDETVVLHNELLKGDSIAYAQDSVTAVLAFDNYLYITYKNKKEPAEFLQQTQAQGSPSGYITSQVRLARDRPVFVLYNGVFYQPQDLFTIGYWAWSEKISSMLPFDYWP